MIQSDSRESSPDPLTQSWNSSVAIRPRSTPRSQNRLATSYQDAARTGGPLSSQSPVRQQQTFGFTSPSRRKPQHSSNPSSPSWKIKVTVQTEEDISCNSVAMSTRTTKVPLKGPDEHVSVTRRSKRNHASVETTPQPKSPISASSKRRKTLSSTNQSQDASTESPNKSASSRRATRSSLRNVENNSPAPFSKAVSVIQINDSSDEFVTERNPAADSPGLDSTIAEDEDTSFLDRSLAESEDFSMVSFESLRNHREAAERDAASIHQENSEKRRGSARKPRGTKQTPAKSRLRQISDEDKENVDSPFAAFGSDTKRHLTAGLALGEMLAREDVEVLLDQSSTGKKNSRSTQQPNKSLEARLPSPPETASISSSRSSIEPRPLVLKQTKQSKLSHGYDEMSWRPTTFHQNIASSQIPNLAQNLDKDPQKQIMDDIHRAAQACAGEIVDVRPTINDSLDTSYMETEIDQDVTGTADIWQAEADRSFEHSSHDPGTERTEKEKPMRNEANIDISELFEEDSRPTRAKIPRTWRRESGHGFLYSDEDQSPAKLHTYAAAQALADKLDAIGEATRKSIALINLEIEEATNNPQQALPKSILSSPERREQQQNNTPKEVRFLGEKYSVLDELDTITENQDEKYFSSEPSTEVSEEFQEDSSFLDNNSSPLASKSSQYATSKTSTPATGQDGEAAAQNGYLRKLKNDLLTLATPRGRALVNDPQVPQIPTEKADSKSNSQKPAIEPDPQVSEQIRWETEAAPASEHLCYLQGRSRDSRAAIQKQAALATSIEIQPPNYAPQPSLFYRLKTLLYSPPPPENTFARTWNRNHALMLYGLWKMYFEPPYYLTPRPWTIKHQKELENIIPPELQHFVDSTITSHDGKSPLHLTYLHCIVVIMFMYEAHKKGVIIYCDGNYSTYFRPPYKMENEENTPDKTVVNQSDEENANTTQNQKSNPWLIPSRKNREFKRVKQEWTPEEIFKGLYAFWLNKVSDYHVSEEELWELGMEQDEDDDGDDDDVQTIEGGDEAPEIID